MKTEERMVRPASRPRRYAMAAEKGQHGHRAGSRGMQIRDVSTGHDKMGMDYEAGSGSWDMMLTWSDPPCSCCPVTVQVILFTERFVFACYAYTRAHGLAEGKEG